MSTASSDGTNKTAVDHRLLDEIADLNRSMLRSVQALLRTRPGLAQRYLHLEPEMSDTIMKLTPHQIEQLSATNQFIFQISGHASSLKANGYDND